MHKSKCSAQCGGEIPPDLLYFYDNRIPHLVHDDVLSPEDFVKYYDPCGCSNSG